MQTDGDDPDGSTLTMPLVGAISSHICIKHLKQLLVVKNKNSTVKQSGFRQMCSGGESQVSNIFLLLFRSQKRTWGLNVSWVSLSEQVHFTCLLEVRNNTCRLAWLTEKGELKKPLTMAITVSVTYFSRAESAWLRSVVVLHT